MTTLGHVTICGSRGGGRGTGAKIFHGTPYEVGAPNWEILDPPLVVNGVQIYFEYLRPCTVQCRCLDDTQLIYI